MNKIYIISILLITSTCNLLSQSGWFWQNPLPQGNDLNAIEVTPDGTIFSAGFCGTIVKSSTGAESWEVLMNAQGHNGWFHDISFLDNNSGWAVGNNWGLFYTTNKGINWITKYLNNSVILYDIFLKSGDTAWACGTSSTIVKTTNNWNSWTTQLFNQNQAHHLTSISFLDNNTGYCVGSTNGGTYGGVIFSTTNSGSTWNQGISPVSSTLETVCCLPGNIVVIATGQGQIIRSTNSGANWSYMILSSGTMFKEMYFVNSQTGWVVGDSGKIYKTTNTGINWSPQSSSTTRKLYSVKFKDQYTGYASGKDGIILSTSDGGENWYKKSQYLLNRENNSIQALKFLDDNTGYCFGNDGLVAKSTDGGITWSGQQSNTNSLLTRACFVDNTIWAAGQNGTIIKTTNGGANWSNVPFPNTSTIPGIYFVDSNTGYVLTVSYEKLYKTTNGGANWFTPIISQQIQNGNNVCFVNSQTGYIIGGAGRIYKTENGGNYWTTYSHPTSNALYDIFFINSNTGWVCGNGGLILKTTNSGIDWIQQNSNGQALLKISFVDENFGWSVGYYGYMRKTTDGGQNWQYSLTGTYDWLQDVFFINQTTGWIVGENSILKTTTGGNVVNIIRVSNAVPKEFTLNQNYPNPFNPVTKIKFDIPDHSNAKIIVYDLLGREVITLVNKYLKPGSYEVDWDGTTFASGVYFYSLVTPEYVETKRMVLIK